MAYKVLKRKNNKWEETDRELYSDLELAKRKVRLSFPGEIFITNEKQASVITNIFIKKL